MKKVSVLKLISQEKHVDPFTELAKTFPKYNENIVNSLYSFLIDKPVFLLIKFENDRKKYADTEVKTYVTGRVLLCFWIYSVFTQKIVHQTHQIKYQKHTSQNSFAVPEFP